MPLNNSCQYASLNMNHTKSCDINKKRASLVFLVTSFLFHIKFKISTHRWYFTLGVFLECDDTMKIQANIACLVRIKDHVLLYPF